MRLFFSLVIFLIVNHAHLSAQETPKKLYVAEKCPSVITIDGNLLESEWNGKWEGGFVQREPYENAKPSQNTEFQLLFDNDFIYVAIKALDTAPDSIVHRLSRKDKSDGDWVGIAFDSYHDLRTAFGFFVSAAGVKTDEIFTDDGNVEDLTWDPIWYVKTRKQSWGWSAEMKIPLTQLRFEKDSKEVWGFEAVRLLFRKNEMSVWQPVARNASGFTRHYGELAFNGELKPKKQFDLTPYFTAGVNNYQEEENNKFADGSDTKLNGGLDGKIGVTNNLTLDFTVNPDFGQVEADPSQVNLTAYETFFVEKRPFFIEGNNITRFPLGFGDGDLSTEQLFYSRRIGRRPQLEPDLRDDEYAKTPSFTRILGAAKLTGKTKKGWSIGIIESLGAEENALTDYHGESGNEVVEPLTNYFVGRLQKDSRDGNTIFGFMGTSTDRRLNDSLATAELHQSGRSAGFDFKQYFNKKNWLVQLNGVASNVRGSAEAIAGTQTSSTHLFQRPDSYHLHYDSTLTSLAGNGGNFQLSKIGGNFNCLLATMWKSPGLELNDIGYLRSTDEILEVIWAGYKFTKPKGIMHSARLNFNMWKGWNFYGKDLLTGGNFNGHIQFSNQWFLHGGFNMETDYLSPSQLRGGPQMLVPGSKSIWLFIETDARKKFSLKYQGVHLRQSSNSGSSDLYSPIIRYQPLKTLEFLLEPNYTVNRNEIQYVDEQSFGSDKRYLLGTISQTILSVSARINVNLRPNLTIEYWGQPFITSGNYTDLKMVTNSKSSEYNDRFHIYDANQLSGPDADNNYLVDENRDGKTDYQFENPNFNFNEFLSNLVLRWEYLPGSALYLVWSQNRRYESTSGDFDLSHNLGELYSYEKPNNTLMIKLSYRIALH
ncbi:MAG TPA: DUF5916 domain-containing protein [Prolixibacteraceae bacterium]|nr:DUF5916 domain-containing protein [Prolixibacteraceae bacterium]